MSSPSYHTSSANAFAVFQTVTAPSPFGSSFSEMNTTTTLTAPPAAICRPSRDIGFANLFDTPIETESIDAPPRYSTLISDAPLASEIDSAPKKSLFAALFTRRRRSSSPSPPPYIDAEELVAIEQRLKNLDAFFGGAAF